MSKELQLRFDYDAFDAETRAYVLERAERIHNLARMTAAGIVQIGQYLAEVKERLKHGKFLEWIEREFAWTDRHARRFMEVYQHVKTDKLSDLNIDVSALYLIAAPSTPEPVRSEVMRRAENGEPVTHAGVRALVQRFVDTGEMPTIEMSLPQVIEELRERAPDRGQKIKAMTPKQIAEADELRKQMKANSEKAHAVMSVIRSIECLASTSLTTPQIAKEIRRLDSPDRDWRGQAKRAKKILTDLETELRP